MSLLLLRAHSLGSLAFTPMAHGHVDPIPSGLIDCSGETHTKLAWCWTGASSNTEGKLWTLALMLALRKLQLPFCGWTKGNGSLGTQGYNSMEMKLPTISHSRMGTSGNAYSSSTPRTPLPPATREDKPLSCPITQLPLKFFSITI